MPKLRKRSQEREENVEDGWQSRQEGETDTAHHRLVRVLWQNLQKRLRKEENLNVNNLNLFFLFSHADEVRGTSFSPIKPLLRLNTPIGISLLFVFYHQKDGGSSFLTYLVEVQFEIAFRIRDSEASAFLGHSHRSS